MKMFLALTTILFYFLSFGLPTTTFAEQCGWQVGGATCPDNICCSQWGWCGTTDDYCGWGCQSNCGNQPVLRHVGRLITKSAFDNMLLHRNHSPDDGFYTYRAFITAAKSFPSFATTGNIQTRTREIAAFLAHTLHGATGDWRNENDAVNYFKTALWDWMSPQSSKPSYHQLLTNKWNFTSLHTSSILQE